MDFPREDLMFRPVMTKIGKPVEFQFEDEIITAIDGVTSTAHVQYHNDIERDVPWTELMEQF